MTAASVMRLAPRVLSSPGRVIFTRPSGRGSGDSHTAGGLSTPTRQWHSRRDIQRTRDILELVAACTPLEARAGVAAQLEEEWRVPGERAAEYSAKLEAALTMTEAEAVALRRRARCTRRARREVGAGEDAGEGRRRRGGAVEVEAEAERLREEVRQAEERLAQLPEVGVVQEAEAEAEAGGGRREAEARRRPPKGSGAISSRWR